MIRSSTRQNPFASAAAFLIVFGLSFVLTACGAHGGPADTDSAARVESGHFNRFEDSYYHVFASGIDWDTNVGIVYYLHGDFSSTGDSEFHSPNSDRLTDLARTARQHNLVLIVPLTPAPEGSAGFTWWQQPERNRAWFESLTDSLTTQIRPQAESTYLMGYSGGAEFLSNELLPNYRKAYGVGGLSFVGGGSAPDDSGPVSRHVHANLPLHWFVGEYDTTGATEPAGWSALSSARRGYHYFSSHGFEQTSLTVLPNTSHFGYDLSHLLDASLTGTHQ